MVNRSTLYWLIAAGVVALFVVPGLFDSLFAFVFLGIIPYTQLAVPVWAMFIINLGLIWLILRWISHQSLLMSDSRARDLEKRRLARIAVARTIRRHEQKQQLAASTSKLQAKATESLRRVVAKA